MDESVKKHINLLHNTLKKVLGDEMEALEDYVSNGLITFDTAWMIFEPGQIVYGLKDGQPIAAKLTRTWEGKDCTGNQALMLTCEIVEWGGRTFGHYTEHFAISKFQGTSKITKLAYFPLTYHEKADQIKQQLIERGKTFESLIGFQYKFYEGVAIGYGTFNNPIKYNVGSYSSPFRSWNCLIAEIELTFHRSNPALSSIPMPGIASTPIAGFESIRSDP